MTACYCMAAGGVPATAPVPAAAVLGERAGREHDGTQKTAEQNRELVYWRATFHNFTT
jgi:hypothetical protein